MLKNVLGVLLLCTSMLLFACSWFIMEQSHAREIQCLASQRITEDILGLEVHDELFGSDKSFQLYAKKLARERTTKQLEPMTCENDESDNEGLGDEYDLPWGDDSLPDKWYRSRLSGSMLAAYDEMEAGFRQHLDIFELPQVAAESISELMDFVLADNPDIFWVGYYLDYADAGEDGWEVYPSYQYSMSELRSIADNIDAVADSAIRQATQSSYQYEQARLLMRWLASNCSYTSEVYGTQDVKSAFVDGISSCAGYSHALQLLYQKAGIPCCYVYGTAINESGSIGNHAWVVACINGNKLYIDPSWADEGDDFDESYFAISDGTFSNTHWAY